MTVYLAFNEREGFDSVSSTTNVSSTTDSTVALVGINRAGIKFGLTASATASFSDLSEGWMHCRIRTRTNTAGASNSTVLSLRRSTDVLVNINMISTDHILYGNIPKLGATTYALTTGSGTYNVDINFKVAVAGFVKIFINGGLAYEYSGDTTFTSGSQVVNTLRVAGAGAVADSDIYNNLYSQFLISDVTTIGAKVYTLALSAGTVNEWAGNLTDVNTATAYDGAVISESTDGQSIVMAKTSMPALATGEALTALVLSTRSLFVSGSAVTKLDMSLKSGGTTTQLNSPITLTQAYKENQIIANQNFFSGTPVNWTVTDLNALEVGLVAEA